MDDEYLEVAGPGDMEVYRRLDAYAETRLAPDPVAMRRIRERLMTLAAARAEEVGFGLPTGARTVVAFSPARSGRRRLSRVATALLAASLTLAVAAGSAFAARPGGTLYDARLWLETVTLPASGEARAEGQLLRLEARLAEIEAAMAAGDPAATTAALEAYGDIMAELDAQLVIDPGVGADVRDSVSRHLAVLDGLIGRVPTQAQGALQHARDRSDNALDHIDGTPGSNNGQGGNGNDPDSNGGSGPGSNGGTGNDPGSNGGTDQPGEPGNDKPAKTPAAEPTSDPVVTPDKTPKPKPTDRPERTPPSNPGQGRPDPVPPPDAESTGRGSGDGQPAP